MKNKPWSAMLAGAAALVGGGKKARPKPTTGRGSAMQHLRDFTAKTIRRRQTTANRKGGWLIPQQPSYWLRPNFGRDIPVYKAHYRPTSKYDPRTANKARECARRRRQLGLGEFGPGRVAA